ncbi:hypothetical protein BV898_14282 [Hypsibius exemplaris]|uniref:Uncharacterized protein n=1 Tax=Hypsibius exemplaris TaxID=2072580 RepID=A0A1W0W864_HYPEX|nr:hypothetical protein BV898_14282 [Hypsibius exemplaris]
MAKLSGVEIIIIIGVGFAVFVILFIVAHRQIARFKIRDLLSKPLLTQPQFGASPGYTAHIRRKVGEVLDMDVQPQMWDSHWTRFFKSQATPNYAHRGRALDFLVLLKLELLRFGPQFNWPAFEDLGEYFERLKTEYPVDRIPARLMEEFVRLYRHCRFDATEFTEAESDRLMKLATDMLDHLQKLRKHVVAGGPTDHPTDAPLRSSQTIPSNEPPPPYLPQQPLNRKETKEEKLLRERGGPKKFPKGYELLESDGSTVGTAVLPPKKDRMGSFARFRRTPNRNKAARTPIQQSASWEEQVPLHVFHDNPLINFEGGPSTSAT